MKALDLRDTCRAKFNPYLRQAMAALPEMCGAHMLDAGCGTGVSLCEIARITDWRFTAVDTDAASLDRLREKISRNGWDARFSLRCGRVQNVTLKADSFDVVLGEGLLNVIGFETGLSICGGLLKRGGWLILHDELAGRDEKHALFAKRGYDVHREIVLTSDVWNDAYIACLREKTRDLSPQSEADEAVLAQIRREIAMFDDNASAFESIYYVLQKREGASNE